MNRWAATTRMLTAAFRSRPAFATRFSLMAEFRYRTFPNHHLESARPLHVRLLGDLGCERHGRHWPTPKNALIFRENPLTIGLPGGCPWQLKALLREFRSPLPWAARGARAAVA